MSESETRAGSHRRGAGVRWRALAGAIGVLVIAASVVACEPAPPPPPSTVYDAACNETLVASTPGSVANLAVDELSGIVASRRNAGVWWVHNDSGNPGAVYAIGDDGGDLGTFTLTGASNVDWEDVAVGPGPIAGTDYLYVADIGGAPAPPTTSNRTSVVVYRVPEPAVSSTTPMGAVDLGGAAALTFTYPGGAKYDAEALIVDPRTGELFIVTKELGPARVFRAPANLADGSTTALAEVATVPQVLVTAADVTAAADFVALRTYTSVVIYPRPAGAPLADAFSQVPCSGATAPEAQGEAIGFTPDGLGYLTASEGASPALHRFHAP